MSNENNNSAGGTPFADTAGSEHEAAGVGVLCECGFTIGVIIKDLDEITAGVWGTIPCPNCRLSMNDRIRKVAEAHAQNGALAELREIIASKIAQAERDAVEEHHRRFPRWDGFSAGRASALRELLKDMDRMSAASTPGGNTEMRDRDESAGPQP